MKKDGIAPFAFADKQGWPAMGTFDILNMRTNGYDFHVSLMAGQESWTDPKVKQVFETWKTLLPYHQEGALGRTWEDAAQSVVK
jgi:multiple sugar transport system substrate-binding protein